MRTDNTYKVNANWTGDAMREVYQQAQTGGVLLASMGNPQPGPIYWDKLLLNASQVTNPPIDPLREPMETRVFLGKKPGSILRGPDGKLIPNQTPQLALRKPILFSAMSYGSISYNAHAALARAAQELGIYYNTGEGGLHEDFYAYGDNTIVQVASGRFGVHNAHAALARAAQELGIYYNTGEGGLHEDFYAYGDNTIVQVASGRFGVHTDYLNTGAAIEIKMGQGAKPGIGGHLPGIKVGPDISKTRMIPEGTDAISPAPHHDAIEIKMGQGAKPGIGGHLPGIKVGPDISKTRMIPEGTDAISPAPHHDIYSIEDLRQLVFSLKEATGYRKPIIVKVAAVHNVAAIASGIARSGADIIAIDGWRGGTGAAPARIRDNVGIPIELALAAVDTRLREEGIRDEVSLIVGGSIRSSADLVKAIALGADAVYIGTAALLAMGCHLCRSCQQGKCNWGIATQRPDLVARLDPDEAARRLVNLVTAWDHELQEIMGGMGINAVEALRGNRLMLRGLGLTEAELRVLGVKHAGE